MITRDDGWHVANADVADTGDLQVDVADSPRCGHRRCGHRRCGHRWTRAFPRVRSMSQSTALTSPPASCTSSRSRPSSSFGGADRVRACTGQQKTRRTARRTRTPSRRRQLDPSRATCPRGLRQLKFDRAEDGVREIDVLERDRQVGSGLVPASCAWRDQRCGIRGCSIVSDCRGRPSYCVPARYAAQPSGTIPSPIAALAGSVADASSGISESGMLVRNVSIPSCCSATLRTPTLRTPTLRTPTLRTPTLRTPTLRTPTLRTPTLRTPTLRTPTLRTPLLWTVPSASPVGPGHSGRRRCVDRHGGETDLDLIHAGLVGNILVAVDVRSKFSTPNLASSNEPRHSRLPAGRRVPRWSNATDSRPPHPTRTGRVPLKRHIQYPER